MNFFKAFHNVCSPDKTILATPEFLANTLHTLSLLEIPILIFGGYCIWYKTPEQMKAVKWLMVNVHFWTVSSDFVMNVLGIPYIMLPAMAGWGLGAVYAPAFMIYCFITFQAGLAASIISVYENRLRSIYGGHVWWDHYRKPAITFMYLTLPFIFLPPYFNVPEQEAARQKVHEMLPCLNPYTFDDRPMYVLGLEVLIPTLCISIWSLIFGPIAGVFLIMTLYRILAKTKVSMSLKTHNMQRTFAIALSLQSLFLFIVLVGPVIIALLTIGLWYHNQTLNNLIFVTMSCHGVGSTMVMIFVHKPYRNFTFSKLGILKEKKLSNVQGTSTKVFTTKVAAV